jgi:hypothetical protein
VLEGDFVEGDTVVVDGAPNGMLSFSKQEMVRN